MVLLLLYSGSNHSESRSRLSLLFPTKQHPSMPAWSHLFHDAQQLRNVLLYTIGFGDFYLPTESTTWISSFSRHCPFLSPTLLSLIRSNSFVGISVYPLKLAKRIALR